jgi:nucleoid-associated protein YgaU
MKMYWLVLIVFAFAVAGGCSKKQPAAAPPIPPGEYVVSEGNSLSRIAIRAYGDMNMWRYLLNANPQLKKRPRFLLEIGETIIVPERSKLDMRLPTPEYPKQLPADYVMLPGDSLRSIAKGCYGNEELWTLIYDTNRAKMSSRIKENPGEAIPMAIEGEVLHIPAKPSREHGAGNGEAAKGQPPRVPVKEGDAEE